MSCSRAGAPTIVTREAEPGISKVEGNRRGVPPGWRAKANAMLLECENIEGDGIELSFPVAPDVLGIASCTKNGRLSSNRSRLNPWPACLWKPKK